MTILTHAGTTTEQMRLRACDRAHLRQVRCLDLVEAIGERIDIRISTITRGPRRLSSNPPR